MATDSIWIQISRRGGLSFIGRLKISRTAAVSALILFWAIAVDGQTFAASSAAQSPPQPPASSPAAASSPSATKAATTATQSPPESSRGVEEIVVTAQKREQLSQQVPIALTALTASNIQFRGIEDLNDLAMQVPGMQFGADTGNDQQIYIRGIGVDDASGSIESPIATYIDGVYQTRTFRAPTLGIDLERIEVLKGPQGTLFGRNATGGALNIALQRPSDELTGAIKGGVGSYGQWLSEADVSGPLIKHKLDLRVAGAIQRDAGWIINDVNGRPINDHLQGSGRVALSFLPLETLSLDYDLLASKLVGGGVDGIDTNILMGPPSVQKAIFGYVVPPSQFINGDNPWKGKFDGPALGDMENTQNAGTVKWDFATWGSIKSITAFQEHTIDKVKWDSDGTSNPIVFFNGRNVDDKAFSEELNLSGNNDWFNWIVGGYYMYENYSSSFDPYELFGPVISGGARGREKLHDYSTFGDITIPLPAHFSLFGGVRYTYDKKDLVQTVSLRQGVHGPFFPFGPAFGTCLNAKNDDQFHNISPRVGMSWAPNESLNFYVKYGEGYNSGGHYFNGCNDGYKDETLDTIEGGVKATFFDGRLSFDASGFYNDFKNFQVFKVLGTASLVVNAPKAEMWGGELQASAVPNDNLTVSGAFSLMHSQYDDFHDIDVTNPKAGLENLSGNQMERAPNHSELIGIQYDWQIPWEDLLGPSYKRIPPLGALRLRGEWYHTDYIIFRPYGGTGFGGANDRQNPYSIFNFYATLPTADGKWSLRFFAKNFLAQKYFQYKIATDWFQRLGVGGQPQWFGADLTYRF